MTLIDKINNFESAPAQTVAEFNKTFPQNKLENLPDLLEIEIGEIADSETTRYILAGSLLIKHNFAFRKTDKTASEVTEEELQEEF